MPHAHESLLEQAYGAVADRDADRLLGLLSDDVAVHIPGTSPFSGTHHGKDGVMTLLRTLDDATDGTFELELQHVVPGDPFCVALVVSVAEHGGRMFEGRDAHVWRVAEGRLAELWVHPGDQYDADSFFGALRAGGGNGGARPAEAEPAGSPPETAPADTGAARGSESSAERARRVAARAFDRS